MNLGKGIVFAITGATAAAALWVGLILGTGLSLWILAPVVGGAAGFGMMKATQMRGGVPAGVVAALITIAAIFGARYIAVSHVVHKHLAITDDDAFNLLAADIAKDLDDQGIEAYDEEGNYTRRVERVATQNWNAWSEEERRQFIASKSQDSEAAAGVLTPLGLLFDFGIFGTICAALAAGTAFKTASKTLETALVEKGLTDGASATAVAAHMRQGGTVQSAAKAVVTTDAPPAPSGGIWSIPLRAPEEKPLPKIKVVSSDEGESGDTKPESRDAA